MRSKMGFCNHEIGSNYCKKSHNGRSKTCKDCMRSHRNNKSVKILFKRMNAKQGIGGIKQNKKQNKMEEKCSLCGKNGGHMGGGCPSQLKNSKS